jgi:mannose-6-phosphate isomerase-like protein (cupin superfamily)
MGEELAIGPATTLRVLAVSEGQLELEARYTGGGSPPPAHFHPEQDERFEVLTGSVRARIGERELSLAAGDVLEIPQETVHQMWNEAEEPAVVNWRTTPAGRTLEWFRELAALMRGEGRAEPETLLADYSDVFRLAGADPQPSD